MCCGGAPDAPDYSQMAAASEKAAELAYQMGGKQLKWSQDMWGEQKALLDKVLGTQTAIMEENHMMATEDRARYKEVYQNMEDDLVGEFNSYGSQERMDLERGRAAAGVQQAFDAQRENAQRMLEQYGIDPSQTRSQAMDRNARVAMAAQQAGASNQAQARTEALSRSLRSEALSIGKGYPSQVAGAYGMALQAGNSGIGNMNATVGSGAGHMGTAQSWQQQGMAGTQQQAGIANMSYQNQADAFQQKQDSGVGAALGQVAGLAAGVMGGMGI